MHSLKKKKILSTVQEKEEDEGRSGRECPFSVSKSLNSFVCAKTGLPDFPVCQIKPDTTALPFPGLRGRIYYNYLSPF